MAVTATSSSGEFMATANSHNQLTSSMSEDAFELIQCFYDGVDVLVRELAEEIAQEKGSYLEEDKTVIAIETEHVREAGRRITEAIKNLVKTGALPEELQCALGNMNDCIHQKS